MNPQTRAPDFEIPSDIGTHAEFAMVFVFLLSVSVILPIMAVPTAAHETHIIGDLNGDRIISEEELSDLTLTYLSAYPGGSALMGLDDLRESVCIHKYYPRTITDSVGREITIYRPVERIVATGGTYGPETLCALGLQDKIVGVCEGAKKRGELRTPMADKTLVGRSYSSGDMEKILELKPDIVLAYSGHYPDYEKQLDASDILLVGMDFHKPENYSTEIRNIGRMMCVEERAYELIDFEQQQLNIIEGRVQDITPEQKPRVYFESYKDFTTYGTGSSVDTIVACGGVNIFTDLPAQSVTVCPESVLVRNPEVIIKQVWAGTISSGYDVDDNGEMKRLRDRIMNRPGWDCIDAVRNGRVYIINSDAKSTHASVYYSYIARWLHPDRFEDIDPIEVHREWFEEFLDIEYRGVYAYPLQ